MDIEEFRKHAHAFADWMADYLAGVEQYPVRAQVKPGEVAARLAKQPPSAPEAMERIFADFQADLLPAMTHWQHPSFFAYFPANSSPPSVLAEMLTATLAANGMLWETSPAATEVETRVMDWLRQMIGLPEGFEGVIQDTASTATLTALLTARERATGWRANDEGLPALGAEGLRFTVYTSEDSHSSVEKAATIAGFGRRSLRKIPTDESFAMIPQALAEAIARDRAQDLTPTAVVATLGSTGVGAVDPLEPIARICGDEGIWLHVDAAWAGSALILPEHRWMIAKELGYRTVPCVVLENLDDQRAKLLTINLNELGRDPVPSLLAKLLHELEEQMPLPELAAVLPYDEAEIRDTLELLKLPEGLEEQIEREAAEEEAAAPEIVSFVVPREYVEIINRALGQAMDRLEGKNQRARGLVLMSEEYLEAHAD